MSFINKPIKLSQGVKVLLIVFLGVISLAGMAYWYGVENSLEIEYKMRKDLDDKVQKRIDMENYLEK